MNHLTVESVTVHPHLLVLSVGDHRQYTPARDTQVVVTYSNGRRAGAVLDFEHYRQFILAQDDEGR